MFSRGERAGEELLLDALELHLERVEHREIAVDHRVHQRVEHVARAVLQQLGLALGARAHVLEAALGAVAHRQHVVAADEDVDLARP